MQFTQTVDALFVKNGVVRRVVVTATATNSEGQSFSITREVPLFLPDEDDPDFVPYANLTEAKVLSWVPLDEDMRTGLESELEKVGMTEEKGNLPWQLTT